MNCHVGSPVEHCGLHLFDKNPLAANLMQRGDFVAIPRGRDDHDLYLIYVIADIRCHEGRLDMMRLPQREFAPARGDANSPSTLSSNSHSDGLVQVEQFAQGSCKPLAAQAVGRILETHGGLVQHLV